MAFDSFGSFGTNNDVYFFIWPLFDGTSSLTNSRSTIAYYPDGSSYVGAGVTRFVGSNGALLERAGTNTCPYSEDFSGANWQQVNTVSTGAYAIAPNGTMTASLITTTNSSNEVVVAIYAATSNPSTFSVWLKAGGAMPCTSVNLGIHNYTTSGQPGSSNVTPTGTWQRFVLVGNAAPITAGDLLAPQIAVLGPGGSTVLAWGAQFEDASLYASSYIPNLTTGSSTRADDVLSGAGLNSAGLTAQGSCSFDFLAPSDLPGFTAGELGLFTTAQVIHGFQVAITNDGTSSTINLAKSGGYGGISEGLTAGWSATSHHAAFSWSGINYSFYLDGVHIGTNTDAAGGIWGVPCVGNLLLGGGYGFGGYIKNLKISTDTAAAL